MAGGRTGCGSCGGGEGGEGLLGLYRLQQALHPYVYCANDPFNHIDPEGYSIIEDTPIIGSWIACRNCPINLEMAKKVLLECRKEIEEEFCENPLGPGNSTPHIGEESIQLKKCMKRKLKVMNKGNLDDKAIESCIKCLGVSY